MCGYFCRFCNKWAFIIFNKKKTYFVQFRGTCMLLSARGQTGDLHSPLPDKGTLKVSKSWRLNKVCCGGFCRTQEGPAYTWLFNFHTFGATEQRSERRLFVSRDQILVPTHSLRDKGTKGQHWNKGTKGQHRKKGTTQEQRHIGTQEPRNKGKK